MHVYDQCSLDGRCDLVLTYSRTADLDQPLSAFEFPKSSGLRLCVLQICLKPRRPLAGDSPELEGRLHG